MPSQEQIDSEASQSDLAARVAELEAWKDLMIRNILGPAQFRPGLLRFGGNIMQLDNKGIQIVTTSELASMYFLPEFQSSPATYYPRGQISGFDTGTIAAAYLTTYGSSTQYAQVQTYTGITNAKPEIIIQAQTTGGRVAKIDVSATDAGSDAATLDLSGEIASAINAQTQITADQNDYDVLARLVSAVSISSDAARNITGIDATNVLNGALLFIQNTGSFAITLKDESASSTAANRFALTADIVLNTDGCCLLQYNTTSSRWRAVAAPASGGVATDTIWDAKGDLAVGTADNTAAKLTVGANYYTLIADSAQTTGLKWRLPNSYNVMDYGALGDNSTNDTSAIQAAIDAANSAGGGTVFFPKGTYLTNKLTLYTAVNLVGVNPHATIIKLRNTQNTALLTTNGFVTTDTAGGIHSFRIENLAFDGNKANQSSNGDSGTVQIYGYHYRLQNIVIRNAETVGLYTNYETGLSAPGPNGISMESYLDSVEVYSAGSDGVYWNGPHDSVWTNVDSHENAAKGINVGARGNALKAFGCHSWGTSQTYGWYIDGSGCSLNGCEGEGASSAQLILRANDQMVQGGHYFAAGGGTTGIEIANSASGHHIDTKVSNCTTAAVKFTTDAAGSRINILNYGTSGSTFSGTPALDVDLTLHSSGGQVSLVGRRKLIGPWYRADITGTAADVYFYINGNSSGAFEIAMLRPGHITGLMVRSSENRTAGTCTVEVLLNDAGTGLQAVLNGTDTTFKGAYQAPGVDTFAIGDKIAVKWTTSGWTPTTADLTVTVEIQD